MITRRSIGICFLFLILQLGSRPVFADYNSARQAMEDQANPLLLLSTSRGPIYLELFPNEAPSNVENFMALAAGGIEFFDSEANRTATPRYFTGMPFHRVIPDFVVQAGSPLYHPLGAPERMLADEINAMALGLDRMPVLAEDGSVNPILDITSKQDFAARVLQPLYDEMGIDSAGEVAQRQDDILSALQSLTVMRLYEHEGYDYQTRFPTRAIVRGTVALANDGPDRNGPEFFITLTDAERLNGRYTVIGQVIEGMEFVDEIGSVAMDPNNLSRERTVIYSLRRLN